MSISDLKNAVRRGDTKLVEQLLQEGVDPNQISRESNSPLSVACMSGHLDLIKLLLEKLKRAPEDLQKEIYHSALVKAVSSESLQQVEVLLDFAGKVHPEYYYHDRGSRTSPMNIACQKRNLKLVKLLLPYGRWDELPYTHRMLAEAVSSGCAEVVEVLLQNDRLNVDLSVIVGVLHDACDGREEKVEVVKVLLKKEPKSVNGLSQFDGRNNGWSALMKASARGHNKTIKVLLQNGAKIDFQNEMDGDTALMVAVRKGMTETVKLLLQKDAATDLVNKQGRTALLTYTEVDNIGIISRALSNVAIIQALLEKGANVNKLDNSGMSALINAIQVQSKEAVQLLLQYGARTDIGTTDYPLNLAIELGACKPFAFSSCNNDIPKLLLKSGAPVNLHSKYDGGSPLIVACRTRNAEMCRLLLDKGADVDHCDNKGEYALLHAVMLADPRKHSIKILNPPEAIEENLQVIEMLLEKGAKVNIVADSGQSAASILQEIASLLLMKVSKHPRLGALVQRMSGEPDETLETASAESQTSTSEALSSVHVQPEETQDILDRHMDTSAGKLHISISTSEGESGIDEPVAKKRQILESDDSDLNTEDDFTEIQEAVMRNEKISRKLAHGMFVGPTGAGKTSLMDRLLGRPRKKFSPSTGVAEQVVVVNVDMDNPSTFTPVTVMHESEGNTWQEVTYDASLVRQMNEGTATSQPEPTPAVSPITQETEYLRSHTESTQNVLTNPEASNTELFAAAAEPSIKFNVSSIVHCTIKNSKKLKQLKKSFSLYLRDAGGQVEFQEILPLLISGPSIFFFVFRLDRDFKEKMIFEYRKSAGESLNCYTSSITTEEAFLQFLASVYAMDMSSINEVHVETHEPIVFVIGTHKDKLGEFANEKINDLNKDLSSLIKEKGFENLFVYADRRKGEIMFTVDNMSKKDEDFKVIRSRVNNLVNSREAFAIEYPLRYLLFSLELQNMEGNVLNLDKCEIMAAECGIEKDKLVHLLQFLHLRIGVIRYFNKDGVRHIVIKEPQVLFNAITDLVIKTFSCEVLTVKEARDFVQKGILTASVLKTAVENLDMDHKIFLQLLTHLHIAASAGHHSNEERYFLPSVLNHISESRKDDPKTNILPLTVSFQCGHCPKGLFGVLVTHLMNSDLQEVAGTTFTLMEDKIFRDQVSFEVHSPGAHDKMALTMHPSHLEIKFFPGHFSDRGTPIPGVCSNVRQILETSIQQSLQDLHYSETKVAPKMCFRCDDCSELHPVKKGIKFTMYCETAQTNHLPEQGECWYSEEGVDSAAQGVSPPCDLLSDPSPLHTEESLSLSGRPELHQLSCLRVGEQQLKIIRTVGVDWKELGLALRFDYNLIKTIESDAREKAHECCRELLHRWLNGEACQPITWARLIEALEDAEHLILATDLKTFFTPKC